MKKHAVWALVLGCSAPAVFGCGDEDDPPPDPRQQCENFLEAWCNKNAACELPSERARALEDCRFVVDLEINCSNVNHIGVTYPECIERISTAQCLPTGGIELPGLCNGVLIR